MQRQGLYEYLSRDGQVRPDGSCSLWEIDEHEFCTPGMWVALTALAKEQKKPFNELKIPYGINGYAQAIRLPVALGENDGYPFGRVNSGRNYSPLVLLTHQEATELANECINDCIRFVFSNMDLSRFVGDLCSVVGDLHDNVWSHGKSTGVSMAQKWPKPHRSREYLFEFALADCGLGFLGELKRTAVPVFNHQSAIDWCIQRGNSSKLYKKPLDDEWMQRMPIDITMNPIREISKIKESENNHQGIGLAKLIDLVRSYSGSLWIASGNSILSIDSAGNSSYSEAMISWQGVAIACRFDTEQIRHLQNRDDFDQVTDDLMQLLGGGHGN